MYILHLYLLFFPTKVSYIPFPALSSISKFPSSLYILSATRIILQHMYILLLPFHNCILDPPVVTSSLLPVITISILRHFSSLRQGQAGSSMLLVKYCTAHNTGQTAATAFLRCWNIRDFPQISPHCSRFPYVGSKCESKKQSMLLI